MFLYIVYVLFNTFINITDSYCDFDLILKEFLLIRLYHNAVLYLYLYLLLYCCVTRNYTKWENILLSFSRSFYFVSRPHISASGASQR